MKNNYNVNINKKRGEITFSMIIVAIIALIVLFVILNIFSSKTDVVNKELNTCITSGGRCIDPNQYECDGVFNSNTCANDQICCKGIVIKKENNEETTIGSSRTSS